MSNDLLEELRTWIKDNIKELKAPFKYVAFEEGFNALIAFDDVPRWDRNRKQWIFWDEDVYSFALGELPVKFQYLTGYFSIEEIWK